MAECRCVLDRSDCAHCRAIQSGTQQSDRRFTPVIRKWPPTMKMLLSSLKPLRKAFFRILF